MTLALKCCEEVEKPTEELSALHENRRFLEELKQLDLMVVL
jgi:hypothetical protein